jgi:hypothetical protein
MCISDLQHDIGNSNQRYAVMLLLLEEIGCYLLLLVDKTLT